MIGLTSTSPGAASSSARTDTAGYRAQIRKESHLVEKCGKNPVARRRTSTITTHRNSTTYCVRCGAFNAVIRRTRTSGTILKWGSYIVEKYDPSGMKKVSDE
jgi:hypothetical protein